MSAINSRNGVADTAVNASRAQKAAAERERTIALRANHPNASLRELEELTDIPKSTLHDRLSDESDPGTPLSDTRQQRAAKAGVSVMTQRRIDAVRRIDPILADRVEAGEVAENLHRAELKPGERQAHLARWLRLVGLGNSANDENSAKGDTAMAPDENLANGQVSEPKGPGGRGKESWLTEMSEQAGTPRKTLQNYFAAFAAADGFTGAPSTADADITVLH